MLFLPVVLGAVVVAASTPEQQVPILFNDHHVMASPDKLTHGRVLAALVKGDTVLVPLRSMFEGTGATVSYDASTKTVHVSKPGADVSVRVGVPEVTINGETRPLDVAPEMYDGNVMVPIRVISEGMGAYVEWVPDKQVVVVRYNPPTPPPTPEPTAAPTVAPPPPTPAPTPTPVPKPAKDLFIAGDYGVAGKTYNEFSDGNRSTGSWAGRAAGEFGPFYAGVDYVQYRYLHTCTNITIPTSDCFVTVVGNNGSSPVGAFTGRDTQTELHAGYKVIDPRVYVALGWDFNAYNNGYPDMTGIGYGVEKLPDLDQKISWYGSYFNYPNTRGTFSGGGISLPMQYSLQTYKIGATWNFAKPFFFEVNYLGNRGNAKANSVTPGYTENGLFVGFGFNANP